MAVEKVGEKYRCNVCGNEVVVAKVGGGTLVCSGDEGVTKPDPAILELTLTRLGIVPEEGVFIDDHLGHVEAATEMGLHGIRYTTVDALTTELDDLLTSEGGSAC